MTDRMDQLIAAAVRQGFAVRQTRNGTWTFAKGIATLTFKTTPRTPQEWMQMVNALRAFGLKFPDS
jgi:hypothetical protein